MEAMYLLKIPFLEKAAEMMQEAEDRNILRSKEKLLKQEEDFLSAIHAQTSSSAERIEKYKTARFERQKEKKTWLYRLCGFTPNKAVFFHPIIHTKEQIEIENWWFNLSVVQRKQKIVSLGEHGIKSRLIEKVLQYAEYDNTKDTNIKVPRVYIVPEFYKYWFIYLIFVLLLISLFVNYKLQSPVLAFIGAICCAFILFFSRLIKIRRSMGLKIFCPVTLGCLKAFYYKEHKNTTLRTDEVE